MKPNRHNGAGCGARMAPATTIASALVLGFFASSASAGPGNIASCQALTGLVVPNTTITSAIYVAPTSTLPGYCDLLATVAPQTDVEVRLPDNYTNRYLHFGGGGFDGNIPNLASPAMSGGVNPLTLGMVLVGSNGGHRASNGNFFTDQALVLNYASQALQEADLVGHAAVQMYYGQPSAHRYFDGCSNGGKNASVVMAVLGDDYDGVVSGDGVYGHSQENTGGTDMSGLTASWAVIQQLPKVSAANGALVYSAQLAQCDAADGLVDGIIANPQNCNFNPAVLACSAGSTTGCLSPTDINTVNAMRSNLLDTTGRVIGPPYGLANPANVPGSTAGLSSGFLAMAFRQTTFDPTTFTVAKNWTTTMQVLDGVYGMSGSILGISRYLNQGKKLIVYHGWDDPLVQPYVSVRLYNDLQQTAGAGATNARVYMIPAMGHCQGGQGATNINLLGGIINWVEGGAAPNDSLIASGTASGNTTFTRPVCAYPKYYMYAGSGDPNSASSFTCVYPASGVAEDVNFDGVVTCADLSAAEAAIGKRIGQVGFIPTADIDGNGVIDVRDIAAIARKLPPGTSCN
jgi:feruloyl esterase